MRGLTLYVVAAGLLCCSSLAAGEAATVESLVTAVAGPDQAAALAAFDSLDKLGAGAKAAVPALIQVLGSEDEERRWRAARTLGAIGPDAQAAVPDLTKALDDPAKTVQAYAAFALGEIGKASEPAVEKLIERAFDKEPLVRRGALRAIRQIGAPPEKTRPLFLKMLEEGDPASVLPMLQTIADAGETALPPVRELLKDEKLCYWACVVLRDMGETAAPAVPELVEVLSHKEPEVRMQAVMALGSIGAAAAPAVPAIVKALESDEFDAVRFTAAFALGAINSKEAEETKVLVAAARSDKPMLRLVSLWTLARQNPDNLEVVRFAAEQLAAALKSDDADVRSMAARGLSQFGSHPEVVGPALLAALQDSDPGVVGHALDAIAALGPTILPKVIEALKDKARRPFAAALIYRMGPQAAPTVPALIEALREPPADEDDVLFRRQAQLALAAIGPEAKDAVGVLIESLASDDREVRGTACYALGKMGPAADAAVPALQQRLQDADDPARTAVIWALLKIRPGDADLEKTAVPLLVQALNRDEELVRVEAAAALGGLASAAEASVIARLKELAEKDPSDQVREAAGEAAKKLEAK